MTALQGRDPMAAYQWNPASVTIPQATLADYVQATGGSPAEVQATQQYGQDLLNAFLGDVGQFAQGVQAADTGWRGRQQDVAGQLEADALRQLALARQAAEMGIEIGAQNRQQALQDQALQLLLQYATAKPKGSTLDITVPNLPFNTVTFPGGNVYVPTSLGGVV